MGGVSGGDVSNFAYTSTTEVDGVNAEGGVDGPNVNTDGGGYTPNSIFAYGAQGFWLDMTDPATWFQNSDGTTPATTLGNPVGFVMDKPGQGYNAIQATSAARPTHGRMPYGGVRNKLLQSQAFANDSWGNSASAIVRTANTGVAPDGTTTASSWKGDGTVAVHYSGQSITLVSAPASRLSIYAKADGVNFIQLFTLGGSGYANFDITSGAGAVGTAAAPFSDLTIQDAGNGWYRCTCLITSSVHNNIYVALSNSSTAVRAAASFATSNGVFLWGAQLEQGSSVTAYQKVVQAYDVTESGVASVPCLWFDGTDDYFELLGSALSLAKNASRISAIFSANISKSSQTSFFDATVNAAVSARFLLRPATGNEVGVGGRRLDANTYQEITSSQNRFENVVVCGEVIYSEAKVRLRQNAVLTASSDSFQTSGLTENTDSQSVKIGRNGTTYYGGFMAAGLVLRDTALTDSQLASLEGYFMNQIGVAA